jgi:hypothetical protein
VPDHKGLGICQCSGLPVMNVRGYDRELGMLNERISNLQKLQEEDRREASEHRKHLAADVQEIKDIITQVKGGWRVLFLVGSAAGVLGGLVTKFSGYLMGGTK